MTLLLKFLQLSQAMPAAEDLKVKGVYRGWIIQTIREPNLSSVIVAG